MFHPQTPGRRLVADLGHPLNSSRVAWFLGLPDTLHPRGWSSLIPLGGSVARSGPKDRQVHGFPLGLITPYFDGSGYRFTATPPPFAYPTVRLTVAAWIFPNSMAGSRSVAGEYQSGGAKACLLHIANSKLQGYITTGAGGATSAASGSDIPASGWSHIAMTWDGATIRLYINGAADGTQANAGTLVKPDGFTVGSNTETSAWYQGYVADVGVWNRALTAAEIRQYILLSRNGYAGLLTHEAAPWDLPADPVVLDSLRSEAAIGSHARRRVADHIDRAALLESDEYETPLVLRNRGWMLSSGLRRARY